MRSNNRNEAITHLAMPERRIPVLIDSSPERADGFVPSISWSNKPVTPVRCLDVSFVDGMGNPGKRKEIEKEHGAVSAAEWNRLRELLDLKDRLDAGDWSPVITGLNEARAAMNPVAALMDRWSPEGWHIEEADSDAGKLTFRSASNGGRVEFDIKIFPLSNQPSSRKPPSPQLKSDSSQRQPNLSKARLTFEFAGKRESAVFALAEAFTSGLSKTKFVVWWHVAARKFVPGLYCPDIVTALYALAMWSSGTAGGWAICQNPKCGKDYPRSRAKQRYCSHKCQVAAAMRRMRDKQKQKSKAKSKAPRRAGRK